MLRKRPLLAGARGLIPWRSALPATAVAILGSWLGSVAARNENVARPA